MNNELKGIPARAPLGPSNPYVSHAVIFSTSDSATREGDFAAAAGFFPHLGSAAQLNASAKHATLWKIEINAPNASISQLSGIAVGGDNYEKRLKDVTAQRNNEVLITKIVTADSLDYVLYYTDSDRFNASLADFERAAGVSGQRAEAGSQSVRWPGSAPSGKYIVGFDYETGPSVLDQRAEPTEWIVLELLDANVLLHGWWQWGDDGKQHEMTRDRNLSYQLSLQGGGLANHGYCHPTSNPGDVTKDSNGVFRSFTPALGNTVALPINSKTTSIGVIIQWSTGYQPLDGFPLVQRIDIDPASIPKNGSGLTEKKLDFPLDQQGGASCTGELHYRLYRSATPPMMPRRD